MLTARLASTLARQLPRAAPQVMILHSLFVMLMQLYLFSGYKQWSQYLLAGADMLICSTRLSSPHTILHLRTQEIHRRNFIFQPFNIKFNTFTYFWNDWYILCVVVIWKITFSFFVAKSYHDDVTFKAHVGGLNVIEVDLVPIIECFPTHIAFSLLD